MNILAITKKEKNQILEMMQVFYTSPAVHTNGSKEIFENDLNTCIEGSPYLEGYFFQQDQTIQGYAMIAKSFSTEFGKQCIWLEDLYVKEQFRGLGIGREFLDFLFKKFPDAVFRLEAEKENSRAISVYKKAGFLPLSYLEMIKLK